MIIKKIIIPVLVMIGVGFPFNAIFAKVRPVSSRRELEQAVAKKSMVVVLFYEEQNNGSTKGLLEMFEDLSGYQPYNDADIVFLKVNTKRKDLATLASLYHVATIPSFIFFNNGMQLLDERRLPIMIQGNIARSELQNVIDRLFGSQMKHYIDRKIAKRNALRADENESWKPYFYDRDMFVRGYDPDERMLE